MTAPRISDADLEWLAFRYAAGELQGTELNSFEELLGTDERACAAVAQAVTLGQAVLQVERDVVVVQPMKRGSARRAFAVAACCVASVAFAFVCLTFVNVSHKQSSETAKQVAALWIQGADEDQSLEATTTVNHEQVDLEEEDAVPAWLLAAVTEQQKTEDGEEMMQD
ncbi:MAG: hypothetical protein JWN70_115 [Planctomycetaceae bacterium]|nr:hypothetical protein [Planctomycetaceae bacterium]